VSNYKAGTKSRTKQTGNAENFSEHAKRRAGGVEIYGEHSGVALFEGCLPVGIMNTIVALLGTAGIAVTYST
jgi:hypothetical protein